MDRKERQFYLETLGEWKKIEDENRNVFLKALAKMMGATARMVPRRK